MRARALLCLFAVGGCGLSLTAAAQTSGPTPPGQAAPVVAATADLPRLDEIDPVRFSYERAIEENYFITTRTGTPIGSGTGALPDDGQIWVDVIRPDTDEPVPIVLIASPYFNTLGRGWRGEGKTPEEGGFVSPLPGVLTGFPNTVPYPEWYDEYFVPRGYAVALMDLRGTRNSAGCQVYGDRDEVIDVVDVIDFLVEQTWSNGKVGMTGGSYDGTIAIGAADEMVASGRHPDALAAIIPIRAIGRWYDYHFFNGVQSSGHAATPALFAAALAGEDFQNTPLADDLLLPLHIVERKACIPTVGAAVIAGYAAPYQDTTMPFWQERDFTQNIARWRAAPFFIHGLFDFNVKTHTTGYVWDLLPSTLPKMIWWGNIDHADPHTPSTEDQGTHQIPFAFQPAFVDATHRWYLQHLKGIDSGALDMPVAQAQGFRGEWRTSDNWPVGSSALLLYPAADGSAALSAPPAGSASWQDLGSSATSARFLSAPLASDLRISGQIGFALRLTASGPDTTVAVEVAAIPPGTPTDEAVGQDSPNHQIDQQAFIVQYAWARAFYRDSIAPTGISSPSSGSPLTPGSPFELNFSASTTDVVIPAGYQLRFTFSPSAGGTIAGATGGTIEMALGADGSRISLPVVTEQAPAAGTREIATSQAGRGGAFSWLAGLIVLLGRGYRRGRRR